MGFSTNNKYISGLFFADFLRLARHLLLIFSSYVDRKAIPINSLFRNQSKTPNVWRVGLS